MDINRFYDYAVQILRPQNNEIGEPKFNNIGEKPQDNNNIIIRIWYKSGGCPPLLVQLYNVTWVNFNPLHFL